MMNHAFGREAVVRFGDGEAQVIQPGDYVVCAVSGARVPLAQLKYWSVKRQEAYAGPEQALQRFREAGSV